MMNQVGQSDFSDEHDSYTRLLRRVILASLLVCVAITLGSFVSQSHSTARYVLVLAAVGVLFVSNAQLKHSIRRASGVLIIGLWVTVSVDIVWFAGVHSANLLIYAFLIIIAGWVMGYRWLVASTAATMALVVGLAAFEMLGWYTPAPRSHALVVTGLVVSILFAISFLTDIVYRTLMRSRDHALALAQQLAEQNEMLAQRGRDLKMIMNHVPVGIASFDAESRLRFGNERYAALFSARPEQLVGQHISDYTPKTALDVLTPQWIQCLAGYPASYRRTNLDPLTGELRIFDVSLEPEYDDSRVIGLFVLMIDVTEKVAADESIRELNATLEQRVTQRTQELHATLDTLQRSQEELARSETRAALSTMIASVSHELSTPLGNGLMTASTLLEQNNEFKKLVDANQIKRSDLAAFVGAVQTGNSLMLRNLQRASDLLNNFRQVAYDHASEQRRSFDLATMVREIVDTLTPSLKRQPHRIVFDIPVGITMDSLPGALGQVVINLTNNAYLHAFQAHSVGVFTIRASSGGGQVFLSFSDNGAGIAPENLPHLFEPFFTTKKGHGGTGLGMGIVESLVCKTLGGSIKVQSEPGVGTRFDVCLPLVAPLEDAN